MTINIQNASNVNVIGRHNGKNCKAIYNITTGEIYASGIDTANALGVDPASVSAVLNGRASTCKGMRLCFVSKMMEHIEEITEANRIRIAKVAAYDADIERRNNIAKAEADVQKWEAKVEELREQLGRAESNLNLAKYDLLELKNNT
jgi:hypothetical protein